MKAQIFINVYSVTRMFLILACSVWVVTVSAQDYKAIESRVSVQGTSNVRDWEMATDRATSSASFVFTGQKLTGITSLQFSVAVNDLKGHAALMNKRAYRALRVYPYDRIFYSGKFYDIKETQAQKYALKTEGNLTIAGTSRIVSIPVKVTVKPDGTVLCEGAKKINMSDFRIRLPEALVKDMDIGDEVNVNFSLLFKRTLQWQNFFRDSVGEATWKFGR